MKLNLGVIYKDNKIINHRSLFKVLFNPIFRYLGFCVGTPFDENKNKINGIIKFYKIDRSKTIKYSKYELEYNMKVIKKRMWL